MLRLMQMSQRLLFGILRLHPVTRAQGGFPRVGIRVAGVDALLVHKMRCYTLERTSLTPHTVSMDVLHTDKKQQGLSTAKNTR